MTIFVSYDPFLKIFALFFPGTRRLSYASLPYADSP